jgi:prepilin-type processing-associated H-X9-DG protein
MAQIAAKIVLELGRFNLHGFNMAMLDGHVNQRSASPYFWALAGKPAPLENFVSRPVHGPRTPGRAVKLIFSVPGEAQASSHPPPRER